MDGIIELIGLSNIRIYNGAANWWENVVDWLTKISLTTYKREFCRRIEQLDLRGFGEECYCISKPQEAIQKWQTMIKAKFIYLLFWFLSILFVYLYLTCIVRISVVRSFSAFKRYPRRKKSNSDIAMALGHWVGTKGFRIT